MVGCLGSGTGAQSLRPAPAILNMKGKMPAHHTMPNMNPGGGAGKKKKNKGQGGQKGGGGGGGGGGGPAKAIRRAADAGNCEEAMRGMRQLLNAGQVEEVAMGMVVSALLKAGRLHGTPHTLHPTTYTLNPEAQCWSRRCSKPAGCTVPP